MAPHAESPSSLFMSPQSLPPAKQPMGATKADTDTPQDAHPTRKRTHAAMVASEWKKLTKLVQAGEPVVVDGQSLDPASVTAVGRYGVSGKLSNDEKVVERITKSVRLMDAHLREGHTVYGINTGFGGSADVRCSFDEMHTLQRALLQHQHIGVLPSPTSDNSMSAFQNATRSLKEEWVRATMLIRANSLARGHSAVRKEVIETLLQLLEHNVIPCVPLRGSISASGDLSPLSYLAGALEGNADTYCYVGPVGSRHVIPASEALKMINLAPTTFGPKEGLGLVNGTAVSCAAASLTLHSLHNLTSLSQLLTAMGTEAILGQDGSFSPFISSIRPHAGQSEVSSTVLSNLSGSQLAGNSSRHALFQDRYSIRTVPQWLGPFLEDLLSAQKQVSVELNSTTDNPLIDPENGSVHHGGNFQAVSVTSAMEKSRLAAQAIGRMLFTQCTELLNHATNRGLPPSLCADEPSTSFTLKGLDISMASYLSEISFLANPVHNHVVSAEMGNQALNSLALISARYTDTAVELLTMMSAAYLYTLCQAVDLRAMIAQFITRLEAALKSLLETHFKSLDSASASKLHALLTEHVQAQMLTTSSMDCAPRFEKIMAASQSVILDFFAQDNAPQPPENLITALRKFRAEASNQAISIYNETRTSYLKNGDATSMLGGGGKQLYNFIRNDLKVPMHRGVVDHPAPIAEPSLSIGFEKSTGNAQNVRKAHIGADEGTNGGDEEWRKKTIGHWVSVIFEAIRDDKIMPTVVQCLSGDEQIEG